MEPEKPNSSPVGNVTSISGSPIVELQRNETWVGMCRKALEEAESGITTGGYMVKLHHDAGATYSIGGFVGSAALLGQGMMAQKKLMELMEEADER